jgi:hypothetical protein
MLLKRMLIFFFCQAQTMRTFWLVLQRRSTYAGARKL